MLNYNNTGIWDRDGHGRGGCDMIYLSIVLISAIKYSCTIYKYINITQGNKKINKNIHNT